MAYSPKITVVENGLKMALLSLIAIISVTIYRPAKVVMTGLHKVTIFGRRTSAPCVA